MNRREFFWRGAAVAGLAAPGRFPYSLLAGAAKKFASDRGTLGPMKIPVSRLAQGTGTSGVGGSSNQTRRLGMQGLADLLVAAYDQGVTVWDSADQYGTHPFLRTALKRVPREKITVLTKARTGLDNAREMRADLDRFRRELGTDYIDILLLHCMTAADWPERCRPAMDVISEAREKGIVHTHGVSCHNIAALRTVARTPWAQVCLARINPAGAAMDTDARAAVAALREIKAAGKGVIGMKVLGAGRLRSKADESLQFVLSLDCVDAFTIGAETREEMLDLVRKIPAASVRG